MRNIKNLQNRISNDSVCIIQNPINIRYFTGVNIDTGLLIISKENAFFITDFRYIEVAEKSFNESGVNVVLQDNLSLQLSEIFNNCGGKKLLIETDYQSVSRLAFFKTITENVTTDNSLDKIIYDLKSVKTLFEIEQIKKAQNITDMAYEHILNFIKVGVKEKDLALEIEMFMRKQGAEGVSFDLITISGKNTSLPHGVPSEKSIENGDFVTMDIGCKVNGYCSDMTRTVAVGFATDEMKKVYETVLTAQQKALDTIKAGVKASDVDKAARDYIYSQGFEGCFGHSTGHGVGLFIHEAPTVSTKSETVLEEGMVITCEPGIYLKDKFGVRIEDMVAVTKNGYLNFTKSKKDLVIL